MLYQVYVDGGHGLETSGKRTPHISKLGRSIKENEFNDAVVKKMIQMLKAHGVNALDTAPGSTDVPLGTRTKAANAHYNYLIKKYGSNNVKACYVSIHYNANTGSFATNKASGLSVHIHPGTKSRDSGKLARAILNELVKGTSQKNRGIVEQNLHVTRETLMPAVLTENGFMDDEREANLMVDAKFQEEVAREHVDGILNFFGIKPKSQVKGAKIVATGTFKDVPDKSSSFDAIEQANKLGLMNGFTDGTFRPQETITRAQLAQVVVNLHKALKG